MKDAPSDPEAGNTAVDPDDLDEIDGLFFEGGFEPTKRAPAWRRPRIIALISPKGGTGKTSIAVILAGILTTERRRVSVLDLDPRRTVRRWARPGELLPFPIHEFDPRLGAAAFRHVVREAVVGADVLIIDTPPALEPASRLSLQVADLVLIPAGASILDLSATKEAIAAARAARHGRQGDLPRIMVIPSRHDSRTRLAKVFAQKLRDLDVPVAPALGQRVEVAMAATSGRLVREGSAAGLEFRRLARRVTSLLRELDS